jgi:Ca-activated chloride channel family protein
MGRLEKWTQRNAEGRRGDTQSSKKIFFSFSAPLRVPIFAFLGVSFLLFLIIGCAPEARLVAQGNTAYGAGAYDLALSAYEEAEGVAPTLAEPVYNAGNSLYRQSTYSETISTLQQAIGLATDDLAQDSYFNLGNAMYQSEDYAGAVEAYKSALRLDPSDMEAKHNLELALAQMPPEQEQSSEQESQDEQSSDEEQQQEQQDEGESESEAQQQEDQAQQEEGEGDEEQAATDNSQQSTENEEQQPATSDQPQSTEGLTEAQARQLLQAVSQNSETLQEHLQQIYTVPGPPPEKDW